MTISTTERTAVAAHTAGRRFRRFAGLLTTPLVPQDFFDLVRSPGQQHRPARTHRGDRPRNRPSRHGADPGRPRLARPPGGPVRAAGVDIDGVRQWRTYSITSSPRQTSHITVTVKAVADGLVSDYLVHEAPAGTVVHLDHAAGDFIAARSAARQGSVRHRGQRHHPGDGHAARASA